LLIVCLVACQTHKTASLPSKPQFDLIGKWDSKNRPPEQFEFFADGSVVKNTKTNGKWSPYAAGTFKSVDATHIKIELQPQWAFGVSIYELHWQDNDNASLRAGDDTIQLSRDKP
jgi:hypothetical protein